MRTKTIVLLHGLFVNDRGWDEWQMYLEDKGYTVYAPAYPGHNGNPSELRAHVSPELAKTGLPEVLAYFTEYLKDLPEKPIVIGHSAGGLVMQKLLEKDLITAGISLGGAPTKDVGISLNAARATLSATNVFKRETDPFLGTKKWYHRQFFNNLSEEASDAEYDKWAVPESRKLVRDMAFSKLAAVEHKDIYQPVLFITGEKDAFFGPDYTKKFLAHYKDSQSDVVDFKVFAGRSHSIYKESGWQEVVEYILNWLDKNEVGLENTAKSKLLVKS